MFNSSQLHKNPYSQDINKVYSNIIKDIFSKIKNSHQNNQSSIIYELSFYFETLLDLIEKDIMTLDEIQTVVWGKIVECLIQNHFNIELDIQKENEKCYCYISWTTSLDKYTNNINKYKDIINKHEHKCH